MALEHYFWEALREISDQLYSISQKKVGAVNLFVHSCGPASGTVLHLFTAYVECALCTWTALAAEEKPTSKYQHWLSRCRDYSLVAETENKTVIRIIVKLGYDDKTKVHTHTYTSFMCAYMYQKKGLENTYQNYYEKGSGASCFTWIFQNKNSLMC